MNDFSSNRGVVIEELFFSCSMKNLTAALEDSISKITGDGEVPANAVYEANLPGTHMVVLFIFACVAAAALR